MGFYWKVGSLCVPLGGAPVNPPTPRACLFFSPTMGFCRTLPPPQIHRGRLFFFLRYFRNALLRVPLYRSHLRFIFGLLLFFFFGSFNMGFFFRRSTFSAVFSRCSCAGPFEPFRSVGAAGVLSTLHDSFQDFFFSF